jgi:PAS domain S-box-containing protein
VQHKNLDIQLVERLRFETLLTDLSTHFVGISSDELDGAIEDAQRRICEALGLERCTLVQLNGPGGTAVFTHSWAIAGHPGAPSAGVEELCPWSLRQVRAGRDIRFSSIDELPSEAAMDKATFLRFGPKSNLTFSLIVGGQVIGALGFGALKAQRQWPEDLVGRLRLFANMVAGSLARRAAEDELRESRARLDLAIDSANTGLWSMDLVTHTMWVSPSMRELCRFPAATEITGETLFQINHPEDREAVRQAVRQAMRTDQLVSIEYRIVLPDGSVRWMSARGRRRCNAAGEPIRVMGAAVDITQRKQLEARSRQHLQELAHLNRVSTVGELTTSLAHELNQPLGAILRNAETAEVLLRAERLDLDELRAIVDDIRKDDIRAGQVIERLRRLLRRRPVELQVVGLVPLANEVASLVRFDAIARRVRLETDLPTDLPAVLGDRVHLQQVLLNLVMNAMDAARDGPGSDRRVCIRARAGGATVEVTVRDSGPGIAAGTLDRLFEPFFTTKPEGMGMGLAIARTLVEAHNGRIWAENNPSGGATFHFTLAALDGDPS